MFIIYLYMSKYNISMIGCVGEKRKFHGINQGIWKTMYRLFRKKCVFFEGRGGKLSRILGKNTQLMNTLYVYRKMVRKINAVEKDHADQE